MALPAHELWAKIQKELSGKTNPDQIAVLKKYLSTWPEEWKGPYRDLWRPLLSALNLRQRGGLNPREIYSR
jgi:hypothetical protein